MKPGTTAIPTVKQQMKLKKWAEQIEARRAGGMTVQNWCAENGLNVKTCYCHLRKVREQCMETVPEIVPLTISEQTSDIHIEKKWITDFTAG